MTTTVTLTPDSTLNAGLFTVVGAASLHAALADASDASYIESPVFTQGDASFTLSTVTLPAGARVTAVAPTVRHASSPSAAGGTWYHSLNVPAGSINEGVLSLGVVVTTQPLTARAKSPSGADWTQAEISGLYTLTSWLPPSGSSARVYRYFVGVTYAAIPVVTPSAPSSPVTTTSKPTVVWGWAPDASYPTQERYQVRVFTAAQYGIGGFDPETSPATWDSGVVLSAATSQQVTDHLANSTTFRAYVRAGTSVNGSTHWSLWVYRQWTMSLAQPGVPNLTVTPEDDSARIRINLDDTAGAATTDWFVVDRSDDGGTTWTRVRGGDHLLPTAGNATLYDYETANSADATYRAQAVSDDAGAEVAGPFDTATTTGWVSTEWWLKSPIFRALNMIVVPATDGIPTLTKPARRTVRAVIGRRLPVVVRDRRGGYNGDVTLVTDTSAERAALAALLEVGTLLLQGPVATEFGSHYIDVGDHTESRHGGGQVDPIRYEHLPFDEVDSPVGDPVGEYAAPPTEPEPDTALLPSLTLLPSATLLPSG